MDINYIYSALSKSVIGHNQIKRIISASINNYFTYKEAKKANILLYGSTGTGKTLILETIAKILDIPYTIIDAGILTGDYEFNIKAIFSKILITTDHDANKIEHSIIFIDEIDKLGTTEYGKYIQCLLLRLIEGTEVRFMSDQKKRVMFKTNDILFIVGGAFQDFLDEPISIGFVDNKSNNFINLYSKFIKHGILPEFIARFSLILQLKKLSNKQLRKIINSSNGPLKELKKRLTINSISINIKKSAIDYLIELVQKFNLGARPLTMLMELLFTNIISKNKKEITLTKKTIGTYLEGI